MDEPIGEAHLGEFARHQLDVARRDPRVDRSRGAMVADFFLALEEAERWREMTTWGLVELAGAVEQEETRLGVGRSDPGLTDPQRRRLQAAWERAEMARAETANEYPHVHAWTLISMLSALDALVDEFVPSLQHILAMSLVDRVRQRLSEADRARWDEPPDDDQQALQESLAKLLVPQKPQRLTGKGTERYEPRLARAGLRAPAERPIPVDLDVALTELGALRDVLVHRGGRVDERALKEAPTLPYAEGQLVRLGRDDYRRYSAAVRAYGTDITQRIIPPEMRIDLADWRNEAYATA